MHMVQAWCKGEGQLQVCVVLNKEMAMSELKKVEQEHTRTMEVGWVSCTYIRMYVYVCRHPRLHVVGRSGGSSYGCPIKYVCACNGIGSG